ncbi:MAG: carbonic anhydrase [Magnetococcales bacterium]|nr:carbonic anhydrase [Magnetococcales bacterium]
MSTKALQRLIAQNRRWSDSIKNRDAQFFSTLAHQQKPTFLWFGCSDSRVPANEIIGVMPGEVFVHRNVANQVPPTDINALSVLQYAVERLNVTDIIVCGHYGCGGVMAAMEGVGESLVDYWVQPVREIYLDNRKQFDQLPTESARQERLCELNVMTQVNRICRTSILQQAWDRQNKISVHGLIYSIHDGLLKDLKVSVSKTKA